MKIQRYQNTNLSVGRQRIGNKGQSVTSNINDSILTSHCAKSRAQIRWEKKAQKSSIFSILFELRTVDSAQQF